MASSNRMITSHEIKEEMDVGDHIPILRQAAQVLPNYSVPRTITSQNPIRKRKWQELSTAKNLHHSFFTLLAKELLTGQVRALLGASSQTDHSLAQICQQSKTAFQPLLVKARLEKFKQLLQHVAYGQKEQAEKIMKADPKLLLLKGPIIKDYAGREIQQTAYQMAIAAGDVYVSFKKGVYQEEEKGEEMVEMIERYFRQMPYGEAERIRQENELFPEGYEELAKKKNVADQQAIEKIFKAIDDAKGVDEAVLMNECKEALEEFRIYLAPTGVITTGTHFNLQILLEACKLYDVYKPRFGEWNSPKNLLAWQKVIGLIQIYLTACDAMALCQGPYYIVREEEKFTRSLKFRFSGEVYFPFNLDSTSVPGKNCAAGLSLGSGYHRQSLDVIFGWSGSLFFLDSFCRAKMSSLRRFMHRPEIQPKAGCGI